MSMTDDWASAFRPGEEEVVEEPVEETPDIPVDQPTIADINEILISLKVIHDENIGLRKKVHTLEHMVANPPWLNDLNSNLQAVLRDNASAMVGANNQFMAILIRKIDELEERLSSDSPAYTNILYSNPELFNEITSRPDEEIKASEEESQSELTMEEEWASINKVAEIVDEEHPDLLTTGQVDQEAPPTAAQEEIEKLSDDPNFNSIRASFDSWRAKEIKWHEFVKAAGGVKNAGMWKKKFTEESSL